MGKILRQSLVMWMTMTAFVGIAFPLIVTGIARVLLADAFDRGLIDDDASVMAATRMDVATKAGDAAAESDALFTASSSVCHRPNAECLPGAFSSPRSNDIVTSPDPTARMLVVLYGLQGVGVGGVLSPGAMPAFGATLTDADVAGIVNHERSVRGNHGPRVTAAMVSEQRAHGKMIR